MAVGIPGLILALLVATLREPKRGAAEGLVTPVSSDPVQGLRCRTRRDRAAADVDRRRTARVRGALAINLAAFVAMVIVVVPRPGDGRPVPMGRGRQRRLCGVFVGERAAPARSADLRADLGHARVSCDRPWLWADLLRLLRRGGFGALYAETDAWGRTSHASACSSAAARGGRVHRHRRSAGGWRTG